MAQTTKDFNNLSKGFTTEASPLNFPDGFTVDEDNCVIASDASRQRREGLGEITSLPVVESASFNSFIWEAPSNKSQRSFIVVYAGGKLFIYRSSLDLYENKDPFVFPVVNTRSTRTNTFGLKWIDIEHENVTFSAISGILLVGVEGFEPIALQYNGDEFYDPSVGWLSGAFTATIVTPFVRDFSGTEDFDEAVLYNLANKGWALKHTTFFTKTKKYARGTYTEPDLGPGSSIIGNNKHFDSFELDFDSRSGADSVDQLNLFYSEMNRVPDEYDNFQLGTRVAVDPTDPSITVFEFDEDTYQDALVDFNKKSNGRFIFKCTDFDRELIYSLYNPYDFSTYGIDTIAPDGVNSHFPAPTVVGGFAGRAWFGAVSTNFDVATGQSNSGMVYFSRVIESLEDVVKCYQEADPTNFQVSDIIASDGGHIQIPEAGKIIKLTPLADSIVVFADNGVWEISGGSAGFNALDYKVSKITDKGALRSDNIVSVGNGVVYASMSGINLVSSNENGILVAQDFTLEVIKDFYNSIPQSCRKFSKMLYDSVNEEIRLYYSYREDYPQNLDRELIYSFRYKAFTKNSYPVTGAGYIKLPSSSVVPVYENVTTTSEEVVTTTSLEEVVSYVDKPYSDNIGFFIENNLRVCDFSDRSFSDFGVYPYDSYLVSGYTNFDDSLRNKQINYLITHFHRTEDGFTYDNDSNIVPSNPSSCWVQVQWDYSVNPNGNKWSPKYQAYRYRRHYTPIDVSDDFDTGDSVIMTKNKVRGQGSALSVKFSSDEGKDFQLLGWGMVVEGRGSV